ncbi:hypothetical protein G3G77_004195 [Salmonella enterica]|nr:hypothetical protein [Salmonella enterica]EEH5466071.1 hypothetical protein [Salmonella enterica]EEH7555515.1 hypothetical protein [Salmonella enterica]EEO5639879.1 hypothetical protein [Salmonella enterica]EEQ0203848.1 hypothetical protein [Salmonella enterica]
MLVIEKSDKHSQATGCAYPTFHSMARPVKLEKLNIVLKQGWPCWLNERLAVAEENTRQRDERHQEQKTVLQDALNAEQTQHKNTQEDLQKQLEQAVADAQERW